MWITDKSEFGGNRYDTANEVSSHIIQLLLPLDSDFDPIAVAVTMIDGDTTNIVKL